MKRLPLITGLIAGLLFSLSITHQARAQKKIENPDIVVGVDGLSCPFCAYGIEKKLTKLDSIDKIYVAIDEGVVDLKLKKGATLSKAKIKKTVKDAGFSVRSLEYKNKEFAQAGPLYDMWSEVSLASGLFHISMAIIGDVFLVLVVSIVAGWICGTSTMLKLGWQPVLCMLTVGFATGLGLEWMARTLNWWTYTRLMPTITLFGEAIGLAPLLQITLLPFFSVLLAIKWGESLIFFKSMV